MQLLIFLNNHKIKLVLKKQKNFLREISWEDEYTLNEKFLPKLDFLLKNSKIKKEALKKITFKINEDCKITSVRLIKTFIKTWMNSKNLL